MRAEDRGEVLKDEAFVAANLGDDVPERKILYEDPELGLCILAHVHHGAKESPPHDHGPAWAIYGQAHGETEMTDWELVEAASEHKPGKVRKTKTYSLTPGAAYVYNEGDFHSPPREGAEWPSSDSAARRASVRSRSPPSGRCRACSRTRAKG